MIFDLVIVFVAAYLLGSIPFGLLLTRLAGHGDIRKIGSGNIGATNVLRTGNKKLAALTLLLDALKGVAAVLITCSFSTDLSEIAALGAVLGHMYPVWLKFKGGKGVATTIGVMTTLSFPTGFAMMFTWLAVAALFRFSSLASLAAVGLVPLFAVLFGRAGLIPLSVIFIALVFFKHRENIRRLIKRTEPKIGKSANGTPPTH